MPFWVPLEPINLRKNKSQLPSFAGALLYNRIICQESSNSSWSALPIVPVGYNTTVVGTSVNTAAGLSS